MGKSVKKTKKKLDIRPVSKKEMERADHALHFYSIETIAKEFKTKAERKALQALWSWFSLNGLCAWATKKDKAIYDTVVMGPGRKKRRMWDEPDAVVISQKTWEHARKVLKFED